MTILKNAASIARLVSRKVNYHSPELLGITGLVAGGACVFFACKATLKADTIVKDMKEDIEHTDYVKENVSSEEYSDSDYKKDQKIIYVRTGAKLVKTYSPAIALGLTSVGCLLLSNKIMKNRVGAVAAALTITDQSFKAYRKNVIEKYGSEVDKEMKFGVKAKEYFNKIVDEKGEEHEQKHVSYEVQEESDFIDSENGHIKYSQYARFFDNGTKGWTKDPELNILKLRQIQNMANDRLREDGILTLNDVYHMLGFRPTQAGQFVGWVNDPKDQVGDDYVDFGIYDIRDERKRAFVNGLERTILLDFNVTPILDHFSK